jgi:hypothetical protein
VVLKRVSQIKNMTCGMWWGVRRFLVEELTGTDYLDDLGTDERVILNWVHRNKM